MAEIKTLADLKTANPSLFNEAKNEGVSEERSRVKAWMELFDMDGKTVRENISAGTPVSHSLVMEMTTKFAASQALKGIGSQNVQTTTVPHEPNQNAMAKSTEDFRAAAAAKRKANAGK